MCGGLASIAVLGGFTDAAAGPKPGIKVLGMETWCFKLPTSKGYLWCLAGVEFAPWAEDERGIRGQKLLNNQWSSGSNPFSKV